MEELYSFQTHHRVSRSSIFSWNCQGHIDISIKSNYIFKILKYVNI